MSWFKLTLNAFMLSVIIMLSSCLGIKPGGAKSGKKLFETFFVGENGTQYFIKPLSFRNEAHEEMRLDITFRYKNEMKDSATLNMSFLNKEMFKSADSLIIRNELTAITIDQLNHMFCERSGKLFNCRFSSKADLAEVEKLFNKDDWTITLYKDGSSSVYTSTNSTNKKIKKLDFTIFSVF